MRLVALKKLRYPRGPDGKEHEPGDEFTALSERDFKALTLVRAAAPAQTKMVEDYPVVPPAQPAIQAADMQPETTSGEDRPPGRRRYLRRDLTTREG